LMAVQVVNAARIGSVLLSITLASINLFGATASIPRPPSGSTSEDLPTAFRRSAPASVDELKLIQSRVETVIARVAPAVVAVVVDGGAGSAVVVSADGLVLCAAHVCSRPDRPVRFTFPNGRKARGKTLGLNYALDCGVMEITDKGPWPHVELGDKDPLRPGDWVLALGHPGGFDADRSVVARLGRVFRLGELLQTDCTLIGGDSGGPLFDMRGNVIGIHSRISESTTENFHVPISSFVDNWDRLAKGEAWGEIEQEPRTPTIGVHGVDAPEGCRLEFVRPGGPGARAGLLEGDLILRVQNESVIDAACLTQCIQQTHPGDEITVLINRNGVEMPVQINVEARFWRPGRRPPGPGR
jgi:serine protease Do